MQSLRLEKMTPFVEWVLLMMVGIFATMVGIFVAGGAVPSRSYKLNPNFMTGSPPAFFTGFPLDSNVQTPVTIVLDLPPESPQPAVLYTIEWHTLPIMRGAFIAAGIVAALAIVYLSLRLTHRGMSREIFP